MTTVRDIAALSGVSISTISRVLNEPEKVATDTLVKVNEAIEELNYVKRPVKKKRTKLFGIIFPNISNPFFAELLEVLEKEAYLHGRCIMFFNSRYSTRTEKIYFNECISHNVDGVFLVPSSIDPQHLRQINEFKFPTVLLTKSTSALPSVCCDHEDGGKQVAEHLLSLGHTKIGYIGPINDNEEKLTGFTRYLVEQLEPLQPEYMFDHGDGADIEGFLKGLIDANGHIAISAIFCMNDVLAQSVIEILNRHDIRCPEDVTVIGFDNSLTAKLINISSVSQPMKEIAHLGFESMLEELKHDRSSSNYQSKMLKPRLVRRNSMPETIHK